MSTVELASRRLESSRKEIVELMVEMLRIDAVNPSMGGRGEYKRAKFLEGFLRKSGLAVKRDYVSDPSVEEGVRPNFTCAIDGRDNSRTLWVVTHLDTVPEGDRGLWKTDPFEPHVENGVIFARGAEDNGQSLVASLFALKTLAELGEAVTRFRFGVAFVSDEEAGSNFGARHLLSTGVFGKEDLMIVPDSGTPDGSGIEVAEKGAMWLKVTTKGRQAHASRPDKGVNAHRAGMSFALELDRFLHETYDARDALYDVPSSTFEPTKKEKNIDNVNTIPGTDVVYLDFRVLPVYSLEDVLRDVIRLRLDAGKRLGVEINVEPIQLSRAGPPTSFDSPVVRQLREALRVVRGIEAKTLGIGGQTVGNLFRVAGIQTAVWSTVDEVAHQANEYCKIENLMNDAKVFAAAALV